jgi:hypothetical protein
MGPQSRSGRFAKDKNLLLIGMCVKCNEKHSTEQPSLVIAMKISTARMRIPNEKVLWDVVSCW